MFKCPHCEKEYKNQGSINLHLPHCKENPENKESVRVVEQKPKNKPKPDANICSYRLLNPSVEGERRAINQGYTKICKHLACTKYMTCEECVL